MPRVAKALTQETPVRKPRQRKPAAPKPAKPAKQPKQPKRSRSSAAPGQVSLAVERLFQRRKKKSAEAASLHYWRTATREERNAWHQRPAGCRDMETAVSIYRERLAYDSLHTNSFLRTAKCRPLSQYPEWCYPNEHPLKTGRKRTLYHRSDFTTPIIDSMIDTCTSKYVDVFGVNQMILKQRKKRKKTVSFNLAKQDDANADAADADGSTIRDAQLAGIQLIPTKHKEHAFTCFECGTHDTRNLSSTSDGNVCTCGAVHGQTVISTSRQKLGASEEEDNTVVGDRVRAPKRDKYDFEPETTQDAQRNRALLGRSGSSIPSSRNSLGLGRLCDAQRVCGNLAAKEAISARVNLGLSLQPRDCIKQRSVLHELEDLFKIVSPVSNPIKRMVRIQTDRMYVKSVQHTYHCKNSTTCDARLSDRHASSIALSCFHYEMDRLVRLADADLDDSNVVGDPDDLQNIEISHLKNVHSKLKRSSVLQQRLSNNQLLSAIQTIDRLSSSSFELKTECSAVQVDAKNGKIAVANDNDNNNNNDDYENIVPSNFCLPNSSLSAPSIHESASISLTSLPSLTSLSNMCDRASISQLVQNTPLISSMGRTNSLSSQGELSPGVQHYLIELRDSIHQVFCDHKLDLKTSSQTSAIRLIQSDRFESFHSSSAVLSGLSSHQLAFCILSALEDPTSKRASFNVAISKQLSLVTETCVDAIDEIRQHVNACLELQSSFTATSDGSLFD